MRSLGFEVTERPFEFSALPGRYAAQIIGGLTVIGCVSAIFGLAEWFGQLTAALVITLAYWMESPGATREPWFREQGINLEARRGPDPQVWLVAHIDTKSQPISTALRSVGVILIVVGLAAQFVLTWPNDIPAYYLAIVGGAILASAKVGAVSNGAADNASGVAALLEAAALVDRERSIGALITDAEELALAGAHAWIAQRTGKGTAINCDTVDDDGQLMVIDYGNLRVPPVGHVVGRGRLPGVLTDSNAFRAANWPTVTLSRGTIRTLNRIHTRRDSLDNLRGTGIPDAAKALARIVEELT